MPRPATMSARRPFAPVLVLLAAACGAVLTARQAPGTLGVDLATFDRSVRPQDDFNRFVNGTWIRNTEIPPDRSSWGSFPELSEQSDAALQQIIDSVTKTPQKPGLDRAAGRRRVSRVHGHGAHRGPRYRAAGQRAEVDCRAHGAGRPGRPPRQDGPRRRGRALRRLRRPGPEAIRHLHRRSEPGRPRHARPRLLPAARPQAGRRPARPTCATSRRC